MNTVTASTAVTLEQLQEVAREMRSSSQESFDSYAYVTLVSELGQSHEDALNFALIFRLQPLRNLESGDLEAEMSEMALSRALANQCVTVDELIEFNDKVINSDNLYHYESELVALRNQYLNQRLNNVGHQTAMNELLG